MSLNIPKGPCPRVVIVGGGFGGIRLAGKLLDKKFEVVLIDKNNYHQFPPLIYQVATAGLEPSSISFPFRKLFRGRSNFHFRMVEAQRVEAEQNVLHTSGGSVAYDYLVIATGTTTNFFGNGRVAANALPLKTVSEALTLRNDLLFNMEKALTCAQPAQRQALLNIVIVGGGPTGVEVAGALAEMNKHIVPKDYPDLPGAGMSIYLVEAGGRLLGAMDKASSAAAEKTLRNMGVDVRLGMRVSDYEDGCALLVPVASGDSQAAAPAPERIPTRMLLWFPGVTGTPLPGLPEQSVGRGRRIVVDGSNRVVGTRNIFAVGDACLMPGADDHYPDGHPQLAQVALQQADLLARNLRRMCDEGPQAELATFRYRNLGTMATIGRRRAVCEIGGLRFSGTLAWLLWLVVHLRSILSVRSKLVVLLNWIWNYVSYSQALRMIIHPEQPCEK